MSDIEQRLRDARLSAGDAGRGAQFHIDYFQPPENLAPFILRIYYFRCDDIYVRDVQPAAPGQLIFVLEGAGRLQFSSGQIDTVHPATLFGPGLGAAQFEFAGPFHHFGLALTPLGFVAMTGKPASMLADRALDAAEIFGAEMADMAHTFQEGRRSERLSPQEMIDRVSAFLLSRVNHVAPSHIVLIKTVNDWLSGKLDPDVEQLYDRIDMSRSTASRLIARYFGSAPKPLMRKYRAVRAAMILTDPTASAAMRDNVESLFYDQPHMIREIRHFTGRTPGALDGEDANILRLWLRGDNYRDLMAYPG